MKTNINNLYMLENTIFFKTSGKRLGVVIVTHGSEMNSNTCVTSVQAIKYFFFLVQTGQYYATTVLIISNAQFIHDFFSGHCDPAGGTRGQLWIKTVFMDLATRHWGGTGALSDERLGGGMYDSPDSITNGLTCIMISKYYIFLASAVILLRILAIG